MHFVESRCFWVQCNYYFLQNAQGCQLGTLQILILHDLVVSTPLKTIVGPSLQGWAKNSTSAAWLFASLGNTILDGIVKLLCHPQFLSHTRLYLKTGDDEIGHVCVCVGQYVC